MVLQQAAPIQLNNLNKVAPPGPPALPFVGMRPFLAKFLHLELEQLAKTHGNIFQIRVGKRRLVVLHGLETIKQALVKQEDSFNARADFKIFEKPPQCFFMEMKNGKLWKKHRTIVSHVMRTFWVDKSDVLENCAQEEVEDLANVFLKFDGKPFAPDSYLPLATLNFMQRLMFGKKDSIDNPEDADTVAAAHSMIHINQGTQHITYLELIPAIWRPFFILYRQKELRNFIKAVGALERYLSKNLKQHQESFNPENIQYFADALLQANNEQAESDQKNTGLSVDDIVLGTLAQFTGAGIEFPKMILHWALLYMITYPDVQAKIQQELDEVVGRGQKISYKHRVELPFTEACINEIFRHSSSTTLPPVPYTTIRDTNLEGYFIPKNTPIIVSYYSLTRDQRYWEEPEQFNPYRFLDKNGKLRKKLLDKFYPFGMGARRCIGESLGRFQIFLFFTNLMHQCKFERVPGERLSLQSQTGVFMNPKKYRVVVKPRF
ncbi:MAG: cytochrome P450 [Symploca sp. SIO1C4]|uniref:Cytochrome P450 n=1 Tax=Symploca sp. SIO1C4 TaxID=2607765 RepID=A0A6B3NDU2_9CYAN|nr:cytochrome P450 [Symploca sp. SIO1C4]